MTYMASSVNIGFMTTYFKEDPYVFTQDSIDGVPFHYKNFETSPCVHIRLSFDYGAMHDEAGLEGTAHFLEHMLFKGSDLFEDQKATQEFGKVYALDTLNASTSLYHLKLTAKCLPQNLETVLNGLFDMVNTTKLRPSDVEDEKKVIVQEIWRTYLNKKHLEYNKMNAENAWFDIPEFIRVGLAFGWPDSVERIEQKDLKKAQEKYLIKNNLTICIAGNLESIDEVKNILKNNVSKMRIGGKSKAPYIPTVIHNPKQNELSFNYDDIGIGDKTQASIEYGIVLPRFSDEKEAKGRATLFLLNSIISDLVFEKLRIDNNLCYSAGSNWVTGIDSVGFYIISKLNADHIDNALKLIFEIMENVKAGAYEDYFNKNKRLIIDSYLSSERVTSGIMDAVLSDIRKYGHPVPLNDYVNELEQVEYKDTVDFAKEYFTKERFVLEILRPNKKNLLSKFVSLFKKNTTA